MLPRVCLVLVVIVLFGEATSAYGKENEKKGQCVDNTLYAKFVCKGKKDGMKILVPGKCSEYYECSKGLSKKKSCSKFFDPKTQNCVSYSTCVEVDNTDCVIPTPPPCATPAPPKPTTPPSCNCPVPTPPSCPAPSPCPPPTECPKPPPTECPAPPACPGTPVEPPSKPPGQPPCSSPSEGPCNDWYDPNDLYGSFVCLNKPDGLKLMAPSSCSDYYYCIGGRSYRKSCGSNLYFNSKVNACDLKSNTICPSDG